MYAASSSTYGDSAELPKVEERIGRPLSPYAATKYLDEIYAQVFGRCYDMASIGLRYFNVFGPRQDPQGAYAAVIPRWVETMLQGRPVVIYGDGETTRDFCYIANVVQANLLASTAIDANAVGQVYNVALGGRLSLNSVFETLRRLLEQRHPVLRVAAPIHEDFRPGDIRHSQADIGKARRLLGYEPRQRCRGTNRDCATCNPAGWPKSSAMTSPESWHGRGWQGSVVAGALVLAIGGALAQGRDASGRNAQIENGEVSSLVAQARKYEHGEGVAQDRLRAASLYCEAARHRDAEAQFSLGWMYANGRGVAHDEAVAAALFALASDQGHAAAKQALRFVSAQRAPLPDCMQPDEPGVIVTEPPDPFVDLPAEKRKIADIVNVLAPVYDVAPRLALAVISVESDFDPKARSPKDARGLMQLIPDTAARFQVKDTFDIRDNVRGGLKYLRWLLSYYRGHVALAAAAYNAGERAVDRYRGVPPYPETETYVQRVLALFGKDESGYDLLKELKYRESRLARILGRLSTK